MMSYTLTVSEAEAQQIRNLVQRTQVSHRPIVLTSEETDEPMAVLLNSAIFERLQRKERQLFQLQLRTLFQQIDALENDWHNLAARQAFVKTFPSHTHMLWNNCPESEQDVCVTLDVAVRSLSLPFFTTKQLAALRECLELLRDSVHDEAALEGCERALIESGLSLTMEGSDSLVELYMDEL